MKRGILTVGVVVSLVFAGIALARPLASPGPVSPVGGEDMPDAIGTLSNSAAGAPSALTLKLNAELQCGRPQGRIFVVHLPAAWTVPDAIGKAHVSLVGAAPLRVAVKSHAVTVTAPPRRGVICDSIRNGWFSIAFKEAAGLRNPASPGSYAFSVAGLPGGRWSGTLTVH